MDDWSRQSSDNLLQATNQYAHDKALFEPVAVFQFGQNNGPDAWTRRRQPWEYTLGDGLKSYANKQVLKRP